MTDNLSKFIARQIRDAQIAQEFQINAGLSTRALLRMVDSNTLVNSPITRKSIRDEVVMWRPCEAHLKGKTTRTGEGAAIVDETTITPIPPYIIENQSTIVIGLNVMRYHSSCP